VRSPGVRMNRLIQVVVLIIVVILAVYLIRELL
jgi:hypothetical protein